MTRAEILTDERLMNICLQLCVLSKTYLDDGESPEQLVEHFLTDMELEEIRWIENDKGQVVAFADFDWIASPEDVHKPASERETGLVLFVLKTYANDRKLLRELKHMAPSHLFICWERNGRIKAPKGWPVEYAQATV